jgi:hypothetical protein
MKEYLIQRLGITDTRKASAALNITVQEGWNPAHFFRTVQGDLGVVLERELVVSEPEEPSKKKKRNGQKPEEDVKSLVDELDDIIQDPELVDGLKDLLS